jgi:hypothetical protein
MEIVFGVVVLGLLLALGVMSWIGLVGSIKRKRAYKRNRA